MGLHHDLRVRRHKPVGDAAVSEAGGPDTRSLAFLVTNGQEATVRADVQRIRSWPYLGRLQVGGFLYDIDTGRLSQLC